MAAGSFGSSYAALGAIAVATIGLYGSKPAFWPLPSEFLSGRATSARRWT